MPSGNCLVSRAGGVEAGIHRNSLTFSCCTRDAFAPDSNLSVHHFLRTTLPSQTFFFNTGTAVIYYLISNFKLGFTVTSSSILFGHTASYRSSSTHRLPAQIARPLFVRLRFSMESRQKSDALERVSANPRVERPRLTVDTLQAYNALHESVPNRTVTANSHPTNKCQRRQAVFDEATIQEKRTHMFTSGFYDSSDPHSDPLVHSTGRLSPLSAIEVEQMHSIKLCRPPRPPNVSPL